MRYLSLILSLSFLTMPITAVAETIVASETLQRGKILQASDLNEIYKEGEHNDDVLSDYIGKQLKRTVYKGHTLKPDFVSNPILVKRNSRVNMVYRFGRLEINAWGRALDEGAVGDVISLMNLGSRKRIQGVILKSGTIEISS